LPTALYSLTSKFVQLTVMLNVYLGVNPADLYRFKKRGLDLMCAAHDEIDQIHESEQKARGRIEDAEKRARVIREEADSEAKALIAKAEHNAKKTASKMLSDIEGKKGKIESKVFEDIDKTIEDIQKTAKKRQNEAGKAVYSLIVGEV